MALNNQEHFLVFIDAADDAATFSLSKFNGMTVASDATLIMNFNNSLGPNATEDKRSFVTITTTADKEKDVMIGIADAINKLNSARLFSLLDGLFGSTFGPLGANALDLSKGAASGADESNFLTAATVARGRSLLGERGEEQGKNGEAAPTDGGDGRRQV